MSDKHAKYQVSIFENQQSFHLRVDDAEEMLDFLGIESMTAEEVSKRLKTIGVRMSEHPDDFRGSTFPGKPSKPDIATEGGATLKDIEEHFGIDTDKPCKHTRTREISGVGRFGPWKGLKCEDCGYANFQNKSGGWKGWQPPKEK